MESGLIAWAFQLTRSCGIQPTSMCGSRWILQCKWLSTRFDAFLAPPFISPVKVPAALFFPKNGLRLSTSTQAPSKLLWCTILSVRSTFHPQQFWQQHTISSAHVACPTTRYVSSNIAYHLIFKRCSIQILEYNSLRRYINHILTPICAKPPHDTLSQI